MVGCARRMCSSQASSNRRENSSTTRAGASPKRAICLACDSELRWHLKPFSSRHCLEHIWQYQRRRWRPFCFWRLAICCGVCVCVCVLEVSRLREKEEKKKDESKKAFNRHPPFSFPFVSLLFHLSRTALGPEGSPLPMAAASTRRVQRELEVKRRGEVRRRRRIAAAHSAKGDDKK